MNTATATIERNIRGIATAVLVPSASRVGLSHTVRHADALDARCDCEDFVYRGHAERPCRHITDTRAVLAGLRALLASLQ